MDTKLLCCSATKSETTFCWDNIDLQSNCVGRRAKQLFGRKQQVVALARPQLIEKEKRRRRRAKRRRRRRRRRKSSECCRPPVLFNPPLLSAVVLFFFFVFLLGAAEKRRPRVLQLRQTATCCAILQWSGARQRAGRGAGSKCRRGRGNN